MSAVAVIVESALDVAQLESEIVEANAAVDTAETDLGQRRIELGRLLCELRKREYPERAKKGERCWGDFLNENKIPYRRASECMDLYRGTLLAAAANSNDDDDPEPEDNEFHILIASGELIRSIKKRVGEWPVESRPALPSLLRDLADEIEEDLQ